MRHAASQDVGPVFTPNYRLNDRYIIKRRFKNGLDCVLYTATEIPGDHPVVIKCIARAESYPEVDILSTLSHPNILGITDHFDCREWHCLVLPRAEHGDLISYMKAHRCSVTPLLFQRIAAQILHALAFIHSQGIIHNDVKLENFLVFGKVRDPVVKLSDFGCARHAVTLAEWSGTLEYASPEKVSHEPYTSKNDIWAAGVTIYGLVAGQRPFDVGIKQTAAKRWGYIRQRITGGNVQFDTKTWIDADGAEELVRNMLTIDPDLRISAASALNLPWIQEGCRRDE
jgi:serine/threonine protein kinase